MITKQESTLEKVRIEWREEPLVSELGTVDLAEQTVFLNPSNPWLSRLRNEGNVDAISIAAFIVYLYYAGASDDPSEWLPGYDDADDHMEMLCSFLERAA